MSKRGRRIARSVNSLKRWWHRWRFNSLSRALFVQEERCRLLAIAEKEYGSSYYTDRYHNAMCRKIKLESVKSWHGLFVARVSRDYLREKVLSK